MIELRYNGCPDCLTSAKALLSAMGYTNNRHYTVTFHDEHRRDPIYKKRPDLIKHFSGAILYNPKNQNFIDLYNGTSNIIKNTPSNRETVKYLFQDA